MRVRRLPFVQIVMLVACSVSFLSEVHAISFDRLAGTPAPATDKQLISADSTTAPPPSPLVGAPQNILGGTRVLYVSHNSGPGSVVGQILNGNFFHSQASTTTGSTVLKWDGTSSPSVQPTGLGGIDLTEDGATAIRIFVVSKDLDTPIDIIVRVFDASDPTGSQKVSVSVVSLTSKIPEPGQEILLPFSNFVKDGLATSKASFTNVGAITIQLNGANSPDLDLRLRSIGTNGVCDHVPVNGVIFDQCGVCGGDNSSCSDCEGTPNGPKVEGTACSTGNLGVCGAGLYTGKFPNCRCNQVTAPTDEKCDELDNDCDGSIDETFSKGETCSVGVGACTRTGAKQCSVAGGIECSATPGTPTGEICDGVDNNCDGQIDEGTPLVGPKSDVCGVCGGDGTSCLDCKGVPNGSSVVDQCGVCGGDGTSCLDCKGTPNGTAVVDQCGVCGGDGTSCLDCKGTPNGTAVTDVCGVCGGDGTSCLDCNGVANGPAKRDACGICGGDGSTCLPCNSVDQSDKLNELDAGAKEQEILIVKSVGALRTLPNAKRHARFISTTLQTAHRLQLKNWTLSWTLPQIATTCTAISALCTTSSNVSILTEYRKNNKTLKDLALGVLEKIRAAKKGKLSRREKRLYVLVDKQFQANLLLSNTVPDTQFSCIGTATK